MPKPLTPRHAAAAGGTTQDFRSILRGLAHNRSSVVGVFSDFARIVACCLAVQTREDEYLERIKGYSKDELNQFGRAMALLVDEMEHKPFTDVLGVYYTEHIASADQTARGEFYTPGSVSKMMAAVTLDPEKIKAEGKPVTVSDPCCGSGAIILSCAQGLVPHVDLMRATLQDINPVACDMAYINTTLWGIPAEIILGNTLTMDTQNHWKNVHWHRVGEDQRKHSLRMLAAVRDLTNPPEHPPLPHRTHP